MRESGNKRWMRAVWAGLGSTSLRQPPRAGVPPVRMATSQNVIVTSLGLAKKLSRALADKVIRNIENFVTSHRRVGARVGALEDETS